MSLNSPIQFNFDGHTKVKVYQGTSYTVPSTIAVTSPAGAAFNTVRATVGGGIYDVVTDEAVATAQDFQYKLYPGDVVAVGGVVSNTCAVSVNGVVVYVITGVTTFAAALLYVG